MAPIAIKIDSLSGEEKIDSSMSTGAGAGFSSVGAGAGRMSGPRSGLIGISTTYCFGCIAYPGSAKIPTVTFVEALQSR